MGSALLNIGLNLVAVFLVFVCRLLGVDLYSKIWRVSRLLVYSVRSALGRKTLLLYTDAPDGMRTTHNLGSALQRSLRDRGVRCSVKPLRSGVDLARCPFYSFQVMAVLVLITDVTQLCARESDRKAVQRRLEKYARTGGCLVLGHDVIYRRSRNEILESLAGCSLNRFKQLFESVDYIRVEEGSRLTDHTQLLNELPSHMQLGDNEVVIGRWMDDVDFLYVWKEDQSVPLVTRRRVGDGRVFWTNSGDTTKDGPPRALARPENDYVSLLTTLMVHH